MIHKNWKKKRYFEISQGTQFGNRRHKVVVAVPMEATCRSLPLDAVTGKPCPTRIFTVVRTSSHVAYEAGVMSSPLQQQPDIKSKNNFKIWIIFIHSFIHSVFCLTTGSKPPPKWFLHIVRSRASSFKWEYPLLSLRSSSSFLRLLPHLLVTSVSPLSFLR